MEARTLVLFWMDMNPSLVMMKRVFLRVTPTSMDIKDLHIPPNIEEMIDNSDKERAANSYDQYTGAEFLLPDRKGEKLMGKVRKRVRYDDIITGEGNYNAIHDKPLYEFEYPDGTTEQLAANILAENMLS